MRKLSIGIFMVITLLLFTNLVFADMDVSIYKQTTIVGTDSESDFYMADFFITPDTNRLINPIICMGGIYNEEDRRLFVKVGAGGLFTYKKLHVPFIIVSIPGGNDIAGLANSSIYFQFGVGLDIYKKLSLEFQHISSAKNDAGINFIGLKCRF